MVCELKITSRSKKNCVKIPWWSDILLNSEKQGYAAYEILSKVVTLTYNYYFVQMRRFFLNSDT